MSEKFIALEKNLKKLLRDLSKLKLSPSRIGSLYGEMYVYNRLIEFLPTIGKKRKEKSADIYLDGVKDGYKKIEVKWSVYGAWEGHAHCGWKFSKKQLTSVDYFVLMSTKKGSYTELEWIFAVPRKELETTEPREGLGGSKQYFVNYYINPKEFHLSTFEKEKLNNENWREKNNDLELKKFIKLLRKHVIT